MSNSLDSNIIMCVIKGELIWHHEHYDRHQSYGVTNLVAQGELVTHCFQCGLSGHDQIKMLYRCVQHGIQVYLLNVTPVLITRRFIGFVILGEAVDCVKFR